MTVPTINKITPQGATEGDSVTLTVQGLDALGAGSAVFFGTASQTTFTSWGGSTIECDVPSGILEEDRFIDVIVQNDDGAGGAGDQSDPFDWWILSDDPLDETLSYQRPDPSRAPKESQTTEVDTLAEAKDLNRVTQKLEALTDFATSAFRSYVLSTTGTAENVSGATVDVETDLTSTYEQYFKLLGASGGSGSLVWIEVMRVPAASIDQIEIPYFLVGSPTVTFKVIDKTGTELYSSGLVTSPTGSRSVHTIPGTSLSSQPTAGDRYLIKAEGVVSSSDEVWVGSIPVLYSV